MKKNILYLRIFFNNLITFDKVFSVDQTALFLENDLSKKQIESTRIYSGWNPASPIEMEITDTCRMIELVFSKAEEYEKPVFRDINNMTKLHDTFMKLGRKISVKNFDLNQIKQYSKLALVHDFILPKSNRQIKVAETAHELIDWGATLNNWVGTAGYSHMCLNGQCTILGVFSEGEIEFCVEIVDDRISQFSGRFRSHNDAIKKEFWEECLKLEVFSETNALKLRWA